LAKLGGGNTPNSFIGKSKVSNTTQYPIDGDNVVAKSKNMEDSKVYIKTIRSYFDNVPQVAGVGILHCGYPTLSKMRSKTKGS